MAADREGSEDTGREDAREDRLRRRAARRAGRPARDAAAFEPAVLETSISDTDAIDPAGAPAEAPPLPEATEAADRPAALAGIGTASALAVPHQGHATGTMVVASPAVGSRPPEGFVAEPAPLRFGDPARGQRLVEGRLRLAGRQLQVSGPDPWELPAPDRAFAAALHGFAWLDDLAALGDRPARETAQRWVAGWITRFGKRRRAGWWTAALAGRRLGRWLDHAGFLLAGPGREPAAFLGAAAAHARFLAARWPSATPGLPRLEALAALLQAGLLLRGQEARVAPSLAGLARECDGAIDPGGGLAGRNPEELLDTLTLLVGAAEALRASGREPAPAHAAAILRIAPTLRALRHADGALARFHGSGRGPEGLADLVLAGAGPPTPPRRGAAMGFVRLAARRTTVIVDAAAPPPGAGAHASTLAFELTSGRRPLVVSAGAGHAFGPDWRRAARATAAHATLAIEGWSSSRLSPRARGADTDPPDLAQRPAAVTLAREGEGPTAGLALSHDGYGPTHGLVHMRRLALSPDGRTLLGEDALVPATPEQRRRLEAVLARAGPGGIAFSLRFPLHPDVEAALDPSGSVATLLLRSGEAWTLRAEGALPELEPAVYLDGARPAPRASHTLVLAGRLTGPGAQIDWTLAKAQDTPVAIRDLLTDTPQPDTPTPP